MIETYLTILIFLILIGGIISIESKNLITSAITLGIAGYGLSLIFLLLNAPDLAIVQVIVESLTLTVFFFTILKSCKSDTRVKLNYKKVLHYSFLTILAIIFTWRLLPVLNYLPQFGYPIMRMSGSYLHSLSKTGASNIISGILFDYRGFDTLGEITIIFSAIVGITLLMRDNNDHNN